jgi:hypothetical protein
MIAAPAQRTTRGAKLPSDLNPSSQPAVLLPPAPAAILARVDRYFNTAGPCRPDEHYMIPAERRVPEARALVERGFYFVIHAPRQTGKTTAIRTLAADLTASGRFAALTLSCETGSPAGDDYAAAQLAILDDLRRKAEVRIPPDLQPPPFPRASDLGILSAALTAWARAVQREAMELKVWRPGEKNPLAEGLVQLDGYLERLGLPEGTLVIFDRRPRKRRAAPRSRPTKAKTPSGRKVTVLTL